MKIKEFVKQINAYAPGDYELSCDDYKIGSGENELTGVIISMFATPDVIRTAIRHRSNLIIVHEPVFYNHKDDHILHKIGIKKKKLAEENGITVYRYHDHAHAAKPDIICAGELKYLGFDNNMGEFESGKYYAVNRYHLKNEMTARELAKHIEEKLGIKHVRIIGEPNKPGKNISCLFGTPGHLIDELDDCDFVLTGEICEWSAAEIVRDYFQFGYNKAVLVMGHIGSERAGMMYLKDLASKEFSDLSIEYVECKEVYSYTDSGSEN